MLLEENFEELRDLVTLENGKDAKDAAGEVRRGVEVVEFACGMPTLRMPTLLMVETVRDVARGIDNVSYRFPLGVVAAIVPFNFPCMIPLWTMPVAIGAGNTYVLKPSERTPLTSQRLVEILIEAGVPEGAVNVVNGAHDAVNGILEHPGSRPSPSSEASRWPSTSTGRGRHTASACRPWPAPRTRCSSCPTPSWIRRCRTS